MSAISLSIASATALAILALPGPTNALMAAIGARRGFSRMVLYVPAAVIGYGLSILVIVVTARYAIEVGVLVRSVGKLILAGYLMSLAARLWISTTNASRGEATAPAVWDVLVTTLVNPKVLVLSYLIAEQADGGGRPIQLACVIGVGVVATAASWGWAGASLSTVRISRRLQVVERGAALVVGIAAAVAFISVFKDWT